MTRHQPSLFPPGREPNSSSGAVTTVTLAIQVAAQIGGSRAKCGELVRCGACQSDGWLSRQGGHRDERSLNVQLLAIVCALQRRAAERRLVSCGPSVEPEPQAPELGPLTDRVSGRVVVLFCAIGQTVSLRRRVHRLADGGISPRSVSARGLSWPGR
jgi:hypothetical protein